MPKIWVGHDVESNEYWALDESAHPVYRNNLAGPVEISNELFERIAEHDREHRVLQDVLCSLRYEWVYPDDEENVRDCD